MKSTEIQSGSTEQAGLRPRETEGDSRTVAVVIPCYNEEVAIGDVVRSFRRHLPQSTIYVYDNNSSDDTIRVAREAGAVVRHETRQGKGNVVRRMFSDVEADIYLLVDGDATYDAASAPRLVERLRDHDLDMVVGARREEVGGGVLYRPGHRFGNTVFTRSVSLLFGNDFTDILSGYRCFSRRFVKSFPAVTEGFEIETELTIHSLNLGLPTAEVDTPYRSRPEGSHSKLNTFSDGWRILLLIALLMKEFRPFLFFGLLAGSLVLLSLGLGIPVVVEFMQTGLVPRFPTAILATGIMILAFLLFSAGMILDSIARMRREVKRLAYLAQSPVAGVENR